MKSKDIIPEEGPMADAPSYLGVRNPYPLASAILLRKKKVEEPVEWTGLEVEEVQHLLVEAFGIPYDHLFDPDPEYKSPLYDGVPEPVRKSRSRDSETLTVKRPPEVSRERTTQAMRTLKLPPPEDEDPHVGSGASWCTKSVNDWIDNNTGRTWNYSTPGSGMPALNIQQGCTTDCYFIAALTSYVWTTNPALLGGGTDPNKPGCRLYTFRNKPSISTQELLAVDTVQSLVFARPANSVTVWSSLCEKAYAVYRGKDTNRPQIADLGFYNPVEALGEVTSASPYSRDVIYWKLTTSPLTFNLDGLFGEIRSKAVAGGGKATKPMVAWTFFGGTQDPTPFGDSFDGLIVANHAYSVLGVTTVNGANCIVLRNPWGFFTGTSKAGIYAARPAWGPAGGFNPSEGNFAMTMEAFTRHFKGYAWRA